MTDRRLRNLKRLRTVVRVIAVLAAAITVAWLVLGIMSLAGDAESGAFLPFFFAVTSALITGMAAHVGWGLAPRKIAQLERSET